MMDDTLDDDLKRVASSNYQKSSKVGEEMKPIGIGGKSTGKGKSLTHGKGGGKGRGKGSTPLRENKEKERTRASSLLQDDKNPTISEDGIIVCAWYILLLTRSRGIEAGAEYFSTLGIARGTPESMLKIISNLERKALSYKFAADLKHAMVAQVAARWTARMGPPVILDTNGTAVAIDGIKIAAGGQGTVYVCERPRVDNLPTLRVAVKHVDCGRQSNVMHAKKEMDALMKEVNPNPDPNPNPNPNGTLS